VALEASDAANAHAHDSHGPLDPLLGTMLTSFQSNKDLVQQIGALWERIDLEENGSIGLRELNSGLRKLQLRPPVRLTLDDYIAITATDTGTFLRKDLTLSRESFERMMLTHLRAFARRKTATATRTAQDESSAEVLFGIKMMLSAIDSLTSVVTGENDASRLARSKVEWIIDNWIRGPVHRCFRAWRDYVSVSCSAEGQDAQSESSMFQAAERRLMRRMDALEDAERQSQTEIRRLARLVQTLVDQNAAVAGRGGRGTAQDPLLVEKGELAGWQQERGRGASGEGDSADDDHDSEYGAASSHLSTTPDRPDP